MIKMRDENREQDEKYMQQALALAQEACAQGEVPIGAIVVCNNRVIATAHNQVEQLIDCTAHAEMIALTMASHRLGGKFLEECTLYVTLEPCPMCMGALRWTRMGRIVYGASDEKGGYTTFAPSLPHPKSKICHGVCAEECQQLIKDFFRNKR